MKIVREFTSSERNDLKDKYKEHYLFQSHLEPVLNLLHCFSVEIFAQDYELILIYSGIDETPYQPLSQAVAYIKANPNFLTQCVQGFLCGIQVKHYCDELNFCQESLQVCFSKFDECFVWDKSGENEVTRNEVTDGMHRLVAYGLVSELHETHFPISVVWGTNNLIGPNNLI